MIPYKNEIDKICSFIFTFTNIDTIFIDYLSNVKTEYGYNNVPEALKIYFRNINEILKLSESNLKQNVIFHSSSLRTNFVAAKIHDGDKYLGSIVVGPYLLEEPTSEMIQNVLLENKISISLRHVVKQYYQSLPLIGTYKAKMLAEMLAFGASNLKSICAQTLNIAEIKYDFHTKSTITSDTIKQSTETSMALIEERYSKESTLMSAIENGDLRSLDKYLKEDLPLFSKIPDRVPNDPLRSRKNLSFVWNTLLRVAARRGGVHPVTLHAISQKFAIQIEKISTISELLELQNKMALSYCDTVKKLSLKNYEYIVREAIEYLRVNLDQDISLEDISRSIKISPYELSRKFKRETGFTITEYINKLRINEALQLLENENMSVTDISQMIGFNDANYFTKVFKKLYGITPSEYRKNKKWII